jgi:hypothetical protein
MYLDLAKHPHYLRRPDGLDAFSCKLSSIETWHRDNGVLVLVAWNFLIGNAQDDFNVARVSLVRIDATVRTIRPAACFLMGKQKYEQPK